MHVLHPTWFQNTFLLAVYASCILGGTPLYLGICVTGDDKDGSIVPMASTPQLLRPQNLFSSAPVLDDNQQGRRSGRRAWADHGLGGPGTGKTTTAINTL